MLWFKFWLRMTIALPNNLLICREQKCHVQRTVGQLWFCGEGCEGWLHSSSLYFTFLQEMSQSVKCGVFFLALSLSLKQLSAANCLMNWYFPLSFFSFSVGRGGIFWVEMFLKCLRHHLENRTKTWYKNNVTFQCGTLQEHIYFTFSVYS